MLPRKYLRVAASQQEHWSKHTAVWIPACAGMTHHVSSIRRKCYCLDSCLRGNKPGFLLSSSDTSPFIRLKCYLCFSSPLAVQRVRAGGMMESPGRELFILSLPTATGSPHSASHAAGQRRVLHPLKCLTYRIRIFDEGQLGQDSHPSCL